MKIDESLKTVKCLGRIIWKNGLGNHRRSLAENKIYYMKLLSNKTIKKMLTAKFIKQIKFIKSIKFIYQPNQSIKFMTLHNSAPYLLNRFTELGQPHI